jgi:hypothetical protein
MKTVKYPRQAVKGGNVRFTYFDPVQGVVIKQTTGRIEADFFKRMIESSVRKRKSNKHLKLTPVDERITA